MMMASINYKNKPTVAVIGSGFGGLSVASLLAKEGFKVDVYEKNEQPGGRASTLKEKGYTFDMGPSWFMMPDIYERFFDEFGINFKKRIPLIELDPQYRVFFSDKTHFDLYRGISKNKKLFESLEPGSYEKFKHYLADSEKKYTIAIKDVLYKNAYSIRDLITPDLIKNSFTLGAFGNIHSHVKKYFINTKLQQILEYNLVFLGCSPDNAPALFSMMAHVDFNMGVFYPIGGFTKVVYEFEQLARSLGVTFYFNSPVNKLFVKNNIINAIRVNNTVKKYDYVISNADYTYTENLLSDQSKRQYSQSYWDKKIFAPSAFIMYLGVKGKLPQLRHHNLYFGDNWKNHFKSIFKENVWPDEPSYYINKPSETDPIVAPQGHENLMVLVPVATGLTETQDTKKKYGDKIISFIEKTTGIKLNKKIVYRKDFSVSDFYNRYNSYQGNALGGIAHTLFQSSIWRPHNKSKHISNLFFVGAGTNPGIGVPTSIISGHLVRDLLIKL